MRMRRKKNLEERLSACSDYLVECVNEDLNYENAENEVKLLDFEALFGNSNRVMLEVGCGKGSFACTYAKEHPDVNIIAVERAANVIVTACETAQEMALSNIKFMNCTAEYLPSYIPKESISEINLNFSCPFPKAKYAKHRLTHKQFLDIYKKIMKSDAVLYQKTDNMHFFEFSIESLSQNGFKLSNISLDLHNSGFDGNIVTEYEKRFSDQGFPIYRLEARM
ncbi:MAG: tRNA (guanosine(46)-N7)-methyltransferase TrmB [Eubacterium sp.]|nr:tRNA (guanosine(46)-N7)-methyltransferase TrmB [Eubacterium sp.]